MPSLDDQVGEIQVSTTAVLSLTSSLPKPVVIRGPAADSKGHSVSQIIAHQSISSTITHHLHLIVALVHSNDKTAKTAITFVEI